MKTSMGKKPICPLCGTELELFGDYGGEVTADCPQCPYNWDSVDEPVARPLNQPLPPLNPIVAEVWGPIIFDQLKDDVNLLKGLKRESDLDASD